MQYSYYSNRDRACRWQENTFPGRLQVRVAHPAGEPPEPSRSWYIQFSINQFDPSITHPFSHATAAWMDRQPCARLIDAAAAAGGAAAAAAAVHHQSEQCHNFFGSSASNATNNDSLFLIAGSIAIHNVSCAFGYYPCTYQLLCTKRIRTLDR